MIPDVDMMLFLLRRALRHVTDEGIRKELLDEYERTIKRRRVYDQTKGSMRHMH
jgi:hypothetical protein